jgi:hypothetical protein
MSHAESDKPSNDQNENLPPRADWDRLFALAAQEDDGSSGHQLALVQEWQWESLVNDFDRDEWTWKA